jgi:hypothetical protein
MSSTGGGVPVRARCHPSNHRPHTDQKARTMNNARATNKARAEAAKPFDATALLNEIKDNVQTFELNGEIFHLPPPKLWVSAVWRATQSDDLEAVARGILGDDDFDRYENAGGTPAFLQDLVAGIYGTSMGESAGSSSSSNGTASPSKRTSSATTSSTSSSSAPDD